MKFNILFVFILCVIVFLVAIPNISALGITPGRTTLNFESGLEREVHFSVMNNEHKKIQVVFMVQGELADYITMHNNGVDFLPSDESKGFKYDLKLPQSLDPGLHTAEITAIEVPKNSGNGAFVGATVAVVSQLYVHVPYPGKYVDIGLNVLDVEQNSTATFIIPVVSRSQLGIGEIRGIIDIYTSLNEKVASLDTDFASLEPGARTELSTKWFVDVNQGNYLAKLSVFYDGEVRYYEKEFAVGSNAVNIESILVNNFQLGEIAKLQILVENKWNQKLDEILANLIVYNHDSQIMADVKSATESIEALSRKELIAYWDTVGVSEGEYDGKLIVQYNKKSTDKNLVLDVGRDNLNIVGVGYAIRGSGNRESVSMTSILLIIVILLLIVNLAWFVFFRRFIGKGN